MNQLELLNGITSRIRHSLVLQEILDTAMMEARTFPNSAPIRIYKFDDDDSGQVIAEAIDSDHYISNLKVLAPTLLEVSQI